jgi:hypothetical protein
MRRSDMGRNFRTKLIVDVVRYCFEFASLASDGFRWFRRTE